MKKLLLLSLLSFLLPIQLANGFSKEQVASKTPQVENGKPQGFVKEGQYLLMSREEFKNWLLANQFSRKISIIQQHHTWKPSYRHFNGSNHFTILKGMETYHVNKMGWDNIAQNITTFPDGKIAICRPFNQAPDGSIGQKANAVGLSIENVGNFDTGQDKMTEEQKETIVFITALLCLKFDLTPSVDTITYHHWWHFKTGERLLDEGPSYNVKSCPGTAFFGGNSTIAAKSNFYPLVVNKMEALSTSLSLD